MIKGKLYLASKYTYCIYELITPDDSIYNIAKKQIEIVEYKVYYRIST